MGACSNAQNMPVGTLDAERSAKHQPILCSGHKTQHKSTQLLLTTPWEGPQTYPSTKGKMLCSTEQQQGVFPDLLETIAKAEKHPASHRLAPLPSSHSLKGDFAQDRG